MVFDAQSGARPVVSEVPSQLTGSEHFIWIIHAAEPKWKQDGVLTFAVRKGWTASCGEAKQQENNHFLSGAGSTAKWYIVIVVP